MSKTKSTTTVHKQGERSDAFSLVFRHDFYFPVCGASATEPATDDDNKVTCNRCLLILTRN